MPKLPKTAVAPKSSATRPKTGAAKAPRRSRTPSAAGTGESGTLATSTDAATTKGAATWKGGATAADRFLEEQRTLLLSEREASLRQAESLRAEAEQLAEEMEPGDTQFDEESGEGATLNVERERDLALSAQARATADEIDVALTKIDSGTYGTCERCGQPIPRARLKAMPSAALCVGCKSGGLSRR